MKLNSLVPLAFTLSLLAPQKSESTSWVTVPFYWLKESSFFHLNYCHKTDISYHLGIRSLFDAPYIANPNFKFSFSLDWSILSNIDKYNRFLKKENRRINRIKTDSGSINVYVQNYRNKLEELKNIYSERSDTLAEIQENLSNIESIVNDMYKQPVLIFDIEPYKNLEKNLNEIKNAKIWEDIKNTYDPSILQANIQENLDKIITNANLMYQDYQESKLDPFYFNNSFKIGLKLNYFF